MSHTIKSISRLRFAALVLSAVTPAGADFSYPSFPSTAGLNTLGNASVASNVLRQTASALSVVGVCVLRTKSTSAGIASIWSSASVSPS